MADDPFALPSVDIPEVPSEIPPEDIPLDATIVSPEEAAFTLPTDVSTPEPVTSVPSETSNGSKKKIMLGIAALLFGIATAGGIFYFMNPALGSRASTSDEDLTMPNPVTRRPTQPAGSTIASNEAVLPLPGISETGTMSKPVESVTGRFLSYKLPENAKETGFLITKTKEEYSYSLNPDEIITVFSGKISEKNILEHETFKDVSEDKFEKVKIDGKDFTYYKGDSSLKPMHYYAFENNGIQYLISISSNIPAASRNKIIESISIHKTPSSPTKFLQRLTFTGEFVSGKIPNEYALVSWTKSDNREGYTFSPYPNTTTKDKVAYLQVEWSNSEFDTSIIGTSATVTISERLIDGVLGKVGTVKPSNNGTLTMKTTALVTKNGRSYLISQVVEERNGKATTRSQDFNYFVQNLKLN